jgi:hypothetical protein
MSNGLKTATGLVKGHVYAMLAEGGRTHEEIANEVRARVKGANTSARSVASMAVDYRKAGGVTPGSGKSVGRVKELVYRLLAKDKFTHKRIADIVRRVEPTANTSHKSVASMAVDYRRQDVYAWH